MKEAVTKEAMVKVVLPVFLNGFGWIFTIAITIIGILLSLKNHDWTIFSRCGSLIVVVALFLVIIDYSKSASALFKIAEPRLVDNKNEKILNEIKTDVLKGLSENNLSKTQDEVNFIANIIYDYKMQNYKEQFPTRVGGYFKNSLQVNELLIGVFGTIVWGFGDLVPILFN